MNRSHPRLYVALAAAMAVVLLAGGCSSDKKSSATPGSDSGGSRSTTTTVPCAGKPIKVTTIATLTGALAFKSRKEDMSNGIKAALASVNGRCQLGRPLSINLCDDQSDPNQSTSCGRKAASDGSLAIFGDVGLQDNGVTASRLPGVLTTGATLFELTNPKSFPGSSAPVLIMGSVTAAKAAGVKDYLLVSTDTPGTQFVAGQAKALASSLGVNLTTLFFPPDTTDFASVAAQVAAKKPSAIGLIVPSAVPFMNALNAEGILPKDTPVFTALSLVPPEVIGELGNKLDGMYLITQNVPPSEKSNAGIKQFRAEYAAVGLDPEKPTAGTFAVDIWSKVHILADDLAKLTPAARSSLNSKALTDALVAASPVNRPEMAPYDLHKPAFPDIKALATFRIFGRQAMAVRVENGTYKPVSTFQDVTKPFTLDH